MEIFQGEYYPPKLVDWWMDDWISRVYGSTRTWRASRHDVAHHTHAHGQRYSVDKSNKNALEGLVNKGAQKISKWMKDHGMHDEARRFEGGAFGKFRFSDLEQLKQQKPPPLPPG